MRVESMSSRLDFDERRARALEGVVQYRARRGAAAAAAGRRPRRAGAAGGDRARRRTPRRRAARRRRAPAAAGERPDPAAAPARRRRQRSTHGSGRRRRRTSGGAARARRAEIDGAGAPAMRASPIGVVKLAVVVQRYGADINGGAELHARYIAERLARHAEVEVVTTCARDYVTWRNELPAGRRDRSTASPSGGFRSRTSASRSTSAGGRTQVFEHAHSIADELAWLDSEGPASPALIEHLARRPRAASTSSSSSAIATTTRGTARGASPARRSSCRRPSAIRRSACRSSARCSAACARIMYNSHEERAMIQAAAGNAGGPGRRRRRRLGRAGDAPIRERFRQQVRHPPAVRDLRRPDRREQGLRRALRLLPALRRDVPARPRPAC